MTRLTRRTRRTTPPARRPQTPRRNWRRRSALAILAAALGVCCGVVPDHPASAQDAPSVVDVGDRRELFLETSLVSELAEGARWVVHAPQPREVVLTTDRPWEGNTCAYYTLFQDGDLYRMYYRGSHYDTETRKSAHPEVVCYAESRDGVNWEKPSLGLIDWEGSRENNIVWNGLGSHCFTPFKDDNPQCPPEERYKAISRGRPTHPAGLYIFASPDGLRWRLLSDQPVITEGAFDSQNLAFWDPVSECYRCYYRQFRRHAGGGVRDIMTCVSNDFRTWSEPQFLQYPEAPSEHLYTNAIRRYPRAPHLFVGFPTRYQPRTQQVEPIVMASRDGTTFRRWGEALIPHTAPQDRDGNRSNYMTNGLLSLPGSPEEFSVYATEAYYTGPDSRVRRFTIRVDGFVSLHADQQAGGMTTHPLRFEGGKLLLNFRTGPEGWVKAALLDAAGQPLPGLSLAESQPLRGDSIEAAAAWNSDARLGELAGQVVRLQLQVRDADVFAWRFASDR